MSVLIFVVFTLLDTLWIQHFDPKFKYPTSSVWILVLMFVLSALAYPSHSIVTLAILLWLGLIDHRYFHVSDFALVILSVHSLWAVDWTRPLFLINGLYVLPFVLLSVYQERMGWGDTFIVLALSFILGPQAFSVWILLFIGLALLYGLIHRKTKAPIALVPFMAMAYAVLLILDTA